MLLQISCTDIFGQRKCYILNYISSIFAGNAIQSMPKQMISVALASFRNEVRKVNMNFLRTVTCVTLRIINAAGEVSEFVHLFV